MNIVRPFFMAVVLCSHIGGCAKYQTYEPAPLDTEQVFKEYKFTDINGSEIRNWLLEQGLDVTQWPKTEWDIESLIALGKLFSGELAVANANFKVAEAQEISAGHKLNPEIELSSDHHSEHSDGISPWTLGSIFSWVYERPEKRQTRINHAKAVTEAARLEQFEIEWQIRNAVTASYLDTIAAIQKQKMLLEEMAIMQQGLEVLDRQLELGQSSDFEISTSRLELQRLRLMISEVRSEQIRVRSRLALISGLGAAKLDKVNLDEDNFSQLPDIDTLDFELDVLQARALIERPDVIRTLSEYVVAEADLHREIENQYPDITLSPGFIFDQGDNLWVLAGSWALPINDRNQGPIAEAEARREVKEQVFLAFQNEVLGQVHQAHLGYQTALNTLAEADSLLKELDGRGEKLQKQYDLGYTNRLVIIRNHLEIMTARRARYLLEIAAWREFGTLEDALMSKLF